MNRRKIYYTLHSGKNSKLLYYISRCLEISVPRWIRRLMLRRELAQARKREDLPRVLERVAYYNRLTDADTFSREAWARESVELRHQKLTRQTVYYLDAYRYAKWFPRTLRWILKPGDTDVVLPLPAITKSRPVCEGNQTNVLLKLNEVRHFIFVHDPTAFRDKLDKVLFRGKVRHDADYQPVGKRIRYDFVSRFHDHPLFDVGIVNMGLSPWHREKLTIGEQLRYKFIMALEGNDVASNLKWVMSSNSVPVMPRPTCETWFMEGTLIPGYHYIEINPDFSDIEEKIRHYLAHPEEAEAIIAHNHEYVAQFQNQKRERLIALLVLRKYFDFTRHLSD